MAYPETMGMLGLLADTQAGALKGLKEGKSDITALMKLLPRQGDALAGERLELQKSGLELSKVREARLAEQGKSARERYIAMRADKDFADARSLFVASLSQYKTSKSPLDREASDSAFKNMYNVYQKKNPGTVADIYEFLKMLEKEDKIFLGWKYGEREVEKRVATPRREARKKEDEKAKSKYTIKSVK